MNDDTGLPLEWPIIATIALLGFITHLVVNIVTPYGSHRDELLYAAMGQHLQLLLGPSLLLAAAGSVWLMRSPEARPFRMLGATCLAVFTTLFLLDGKGYYVGPIYPTLFAAVSLGVSREDLEKFFGTVTAAGRITNDWTVEEEQDLTVYVCEQPRESLQSLWPKLAGRN